MATGEPNGSLNRPSTSQYWEWTTRVLVALCVGLLGTFSIAARAYISDLNEKTAVTAAHVQELQQWKAERKGNEYNSNMALREQQRQEEKHHQIRREILTVIEGLREDLREVRDSQIRLEVELGTYPGKGTPP